MNDIDRLVTTVEHHPVTAVITAVGALVVTAALIAAVIRGVRIGRRRGITGEQVGTLVAAGIATGVSAQGMWVFFDRSLHLTLSLRIMFFAFLEIMVLTSALRARSAQRVSGSAGIDGVAMWVLTCLSAVLAATDADNLGTVLIRLAAPLVAAWGWERSMALERRQTRGVGGINWRLTPERVLIRLGLADPTERSAGEVAAQRRLIQVALAADRARILRDDAAGSRRAHRAQRRLQQAMRRAVEDGGLVDNSREPRAVLLDNLRVLSNTGALLDLDLPHPWVLDEPAPSARVQPPELESLSTAPGSEPAHDRPATAPAVATGATSANAASSSDITSSDTSTNDTSANATESASRAGGRATDGADPRPQLGAPSSSAPRGPESVPATSASESEVRRAEWIPGAGGSAARPTHFAAAVDGRNGADGTGHRPAAESDYPTDLLPIQGFDPDGADGDSSSASQRNRQLRRDPLIRERVRELRSAGKPATEIAAELDTSPRTIGRIIADLDAETAEQDDDPARPGLGRNPAKVAVSNWHNGFRILDGGGTDSPPLVPHDPPDRPEPEHSDLVRSERSGSN